MYNFLTGVPKLAGGGPDMQTHTTKSNQNIEINWSMSSY